MEPQGPIKTMNARRTERDKINKDVELYLANGGKIKQVDSSSNQSAIERLKNRSDITKNVRDRLIEEVKKRGGL